MSWLDIVNFGAVPSLKTLTDSASFRKYLDEYSRGAVLSEKFWLGYALLAALVFDTLIKRLLDNPSQFGIPGRETVERSFQGDEPLSEFPGASRQGRMILHLTRMYRDLISVRSVADLETRSKQVTDGVVNPLRIWVDQFIFKSGDGKKEISADEALSLAGPVFLHYNAHDVRFVKLAFNHHFRQDQQHLGQARRLPEDFFEGYKVTLLFLWKELMGEGNAKFENYEKVQASKTWAQFNSLYGDVQDEIDEGIEAELHKISATKKRPFDTKFATMLAVRGRRTSPRTLERRLDERFLHYIVRIVDEEWTNEAGGGCLVALSGAIQTSADKVRVIRFVHPEPGGHGFGYAVLLYNHHLFWNYSQWWLFHNFCGDNSGTASGAHNEIEKFLTEHKSRLSVTSFKIRAKDLVDYIHTHPRPAISGFPQELGDYFETETLSGLRRLLERTRDGEQKAKGVALELLAVKLLSSRGFETVWSYGKKQVGKEVDVVGFKLEGDEGLFQLAECSNYWEEEDELIDEMEGKIALAEKSIPILLKEFGSPKIANFKVRGTIITTDGLDPKLNRKQGDVEILDKEALKAECKARNIGWPGVLDSVFPDKKFIPTVEFGSLAGFKQAVEQDFEEEKDDPS